jgi:hypothetical protein
MPRRIPLHPAVLGAAAVLLGAGLRFYRLSSLAPEAWFDEIWFALRARELLQHPALIVFYKTPWGGGNALLVYLTAAARLLGFTGPSGSRVVSAALGVLAVPLAYACFGEMLRGQGLPARRWAAAIAAFCLSYLLYWVIVSRVGTEPSLAPAAALFCVWQLKRGRRALAAPGARPAGRPGLHFLAAGLAAGLAQYNGPHARFVLPLVALVGLHDWLLSPAPRRAALAAGYAAAAAMAALAAAPLIAFFIQEPAWFLARARLTGASATSPLSDPVELRRNLWFLSISFNVMGSFDPLTNFPGLPMFDAVQSIGWAIGHGWAFWNLRRSGLARELLAWEGLMIVPSLVTSDAPNFQRMIGVAAPAACLIALGWLMALRWTFSTRFAGPLAPLVRLAGAGLLGLGLIVSPLYQAYTLLVRYPAQSILPASFLNAPVRVARQLAARAAGGERVFVSRHPEDADAQNDVIAFEFLLPGTPVQRLDFRQCLPLSDGRTARTNYLVLTNRDKQSVPQLHSAYPASRVTADYYWQDNGSWLEVPAGAPGPRPPILSAALFEPGLRLLGYEWSGGAIQAGQSLFLTLWWRAEADLSADYTSFLHLGRQTVVAQRDGQPCQGLFPTSHWRAGDLVRDSFALTLPPETPPGVYPLAVGWYTYPDLTRLRLAAADQPLPDDRAVIGSLTVTH